MSHTLKFFFINFIFHLIIVNNKTCKNIIRLLLAYSYAENNENFRILKTKLDCL